MKLELGTLELKALKELAVSGSNTVGGLASVLKRSNTRVSIALKDLEAKGFLDTERAGISKRVFFSNTKHAQLIKTMFSRDPYIIFERMLYGSALVILLPMVYDRLDMTDLAQESGCSVITVKRTIKRMKGIGMVVRSESALYGINERYVGLMDFVREFQYYLNLKVAQSFSEDSTILWQRGNEFLVKTRKQEPSGHFFLTSVTAYHKLGIQLILLDSNYYYYSPNKKSLKIEDIILHGLILDRISTREILYAMLVWQKNIDKLHINYLLDESRKYDLRATVDAIIAYFDSKGRNRAKYFPKWDEYMQKAEEYEL